jgi:DNA repair ATPase RecN
MRHDVDDVYGLLTTTSERLDAVSTRLDTVWTVQRRHGNRLEEIQQSLDLQSGRMDRLEDNQRQQSELLGGLAETQKQILDLLRRQSAG